MTAPITLVKTNGKMQSWSWNYLQSCTAIVLVRLREGVVRPGWTQNYTQLEVSGKFDFLLNNPLLPPTSWKLPWHCLNRWLILFLYFQHLNWSSYGEKKINWTFPLPYSPSYAHRPPVDSWHWTKRPQQWCRAFSPASGTRGTRVGFQLDIEQLLCKRSLPKVTSTSARFPTLFKLGMNNHTWLHSTPLHTWKVWWLCLWELSSLPSMKPHRCQVKTMEIHPKTSVDSSQSH